MAATNVMSWTSQQQDHEKCWSRGRRRNSRNKQCLYYKIFWSVISWAVYSQKGFFLFFSFWIWILRNLHGNQMERKITEVAGEKTSAKLTGMVQLQFNFKLCQSICKKMKEIVKAPITRLSKELKERQLWIVS